MSAAGRAEGAPLVTTGDKSHPRAPALADSGAWISPDGQVLDAAWLATAACPTPSRGVGFQLVDGSIVPAGCNRSRCPYCAIRHGLTAHEMLKLTCALMGPPQVALTLTSKNPSYDAWCDDLRAILRALRRRWPDVQYLAFMEWTTGKGARSGGFRRPHAHLLLRGIPADHAPMAEDVIRRLWKQRTGATRIEAAPLRSTEAGVAYLALHHLKGEQAPPDYWRGRRLRPSKGWYGQNATDLRRAAVTAVAERSHRARVKKQRAAELLALMEVGWDPEAAAEAVYGPPEHPRPLPAREPARFVLLRPRHA